MIGFLLGVANGVGGFYLLSRICRALTLENRPAHWYGIAKLFLTLASAALCVAVVPGQLPLFAAGASGALIAGAFLAFLRQRKRAREGRE